MGAAAAPLAPLSQAHEHTLRQCEALARRACASGSHCPR